MSDRVYFAKNINGLLTAVDDDKKGVVKKGSFWSRNVTIGTQLVNRGSLIKYINTENQKKQGFKQLNRGWCFGLFGGSGDARIRTELLTIVKEVREDKEVKKKPKKGVFETVKGYIPSEIRGGKQLKKPKHPFRKDLGEVALNELRPPGGDHGFLIKTMTGATHQIYVKNDVTCEDLITQVSAVCMMTRARTLVIFSGRSIESTTDKLPDEVIKEGFLHVVNRWFVDTTTKDDFNKLVETWAFWNDKKYRLYSDFEQRLLSFTDRIFRGQIIFGANYNYIDDFNEFQEEINGIRKMVLNHEVMLKKELTEEQKATIESTLAGAESMLGYAKKTYEKAMSLLGAKDLVEFDKMLTETLGKKAKPACKVKPNRATIGIKVGAKRVEFDKDNLLIHFESLKNMLDDGINVEAVYDDEGNIKIQEWYPEASEQLLENLNLFLIDPTTNNFEKMSERELIDLYLCGIQIDMSTLYLTIEKEIRRRLVVDAWADVDLLKQLRQYANLGRLVDVFYPELEK